MCSGSDLMGVGPGRHAPVLRGGGGARGQKGALFAGATNQMQPMPEPVAVFVVMLAI